MSSELKEIMKLTLISKLVFLHHFLAPLSNQDGFLDSAKPPICKLCEPYTLKLLYPFGNHLLRGPYTSHLCETLKPHPFPLAFCRQHLYPITKSTLPTILSGPFQLLRVVCNLRRSLRKQKYYQNNTWSNQFSDQCPKCIARIVYIEPAQLFLLVRTSTSWVLRYMAR